MTAAHDDRAESPDLAPTVLVERVDLQRSGAQLGVIRLNEPERLNPLNWEKFRLIRQGLLELEDDPAVRAVAVTGTGRAFSAGGDLSAYQTLQRDPVEFPRYMDDAHAAFETPSEMTKPVVALVNGIAVAGGLELVLACDFAFAARSARLGDAHINYAQLGGGGALTLLPRIIGVARAKELAFSGSLISAEQALDWGLVNRVVADEDLMTAAVEFAELVSHHSTLALANVKRVMTRNYKSGASVAEAIQIERETVLRYCLTSDDAPEGLRAFAEHRRGRYQGR